MASRSHALVHHTMTGMGPTYRGWRTRHAATAPCRASRRHALPPAFTLVELLVSIAILAVLLSLLLPAVRGAIAAARGFKCQIGLRSVAFDFTIFADDLLHGDRGDDSRDLPRGAFRLETFQNSQYNVNEFWAWPDQSEVQMPDSRGNDPMRCPEVHGTVTLRRNVPCSQGAIDPPQSISFGFNIRLHRPEVLLNGQPAVPQVQLRSSILQAGQVPLVWDVDGETATARGQYPVYSGPSLGSVAYPGDILWYPALRHNGEANFAFVDGHVAPSRRPLREPGWLWGYQPVR